MGFVRTAEEIRKIEQRFAQPRFVGGERLTVEFLTDPVTVRRLLPPPLEPAAQPLVSIGIGRWRSNGVGDYSGGSLYIAARHGGVDGGYALAMWMDTEPAVLFGREVFGEPKKLATARLFRSGGHFQASIERLGVVLVELSAELGRDLGAYEEERVAFNFRSRPAADGVGLDGPVVLTRARFSTTVKRGLEGTGRVRLRGTVHDPLDEIEVRSVVRATFSEHDIVARCEPVAEVPARDFLPYHHGRADDWLALDTSA